MAIQIVLPRQVVFTVESNKGLIQQFEKAGRPEFAEPFLDAIEENPNAQSFIIELEPTMVLRLRDFLSSRRSEAFSILKKSLKGLEAGAKPIRQQDVLRVALAQLGVTSLEQIRSEEDREQLAIALSNQGAKPQQVTRALQRAVQKTRLKGDTDSRQNIIAIARSLRAFEIIGREAKGQTKLFPSSERASSRPLIAQEVATQFGAKKDRLQAIFDTKRAEFAGRTAGIIEGAISQTEKETRRAGKAAARGAGRGAVIAGKGVLIGSRAAVRVGLPAAKRGTKRGHALARQAAAATRPQLALATKFTREEAIPAAKQVASDVATTIATSTSIAADRAITKAREIGRGIQSRDRIAIGRFRAVEAGREDKATKIANLLFEVGIGPKEWNPLKPEERSKLLKEAVTDEEFIVLTRLIDFRFSIPFSPLTRIEELNLPPEPEQVFPSPKVPSRLAVGEKPRPIIEQAPDSDSLVAFNQGVEERLEKLAEK